MTGPKSGIDLHPAERGPWMEAWVRDDRGVVVRRYRCRQGKWEVTFGFGERWRGCESPDLPGDILAKLEAA